MKITSGKFKYRKIEIPRGIRPTTEKVREAVFSIASAWMRDSVVMDMFAGSGAMGLEALSRGASYCYFCESSKANYNVLLENISACAAGEESTVYNTDYRTAIARMEEIGVKLDAVFIDPPYDREDYYGISMNMLQDAKLLDEGSIVIAEHLYDNKLSDNYGKLHRFREKKYGSIGVDVYIFEN